MLEYLHVADIPYLGECLLDRPKYDKHNLMEIAIEQKAWNSSCGNCEHTEAVSRWQTQAGGWAPSDNVCHRLAPVICTLHRGTAADAPHPAVRVPPHACLAWQLRSAWPPSPIPHRPLITTFCRAPDGNRDPDPLQANSSPKRLGAEALLLQLDMASLQ